MTFHSEPDLQESFFCIWRDGFTPPVVKHRRLEDAETEAARLCKKHPEEEFYILRSVCVMQGRVSISKVSTY